MKTKRVLMVAFEFPPSNGASVQRIMSIYNQFASDGWEVDVLTMHPKAYADGNTSGGKELTPEQTHGKIMRPMAYDVLRDLAWKGKYIGCLMSPDRWGLTWVPNAAWVIRNYLKDSGAPDLIWSSAPVASVHAVGYIAHRLSKAPWMADYRDPLPHTHVKGLPWYQEKPQQWIDKWVCDFAAKKTFATSSMMDIYTNKQGFNSKDCSVISNGFLQSNFDQALNLEVDTSLFRAERFSLYYSGVLYDHGRCPRDVFKAVKKWNDMNPNMLVEVVFQGVLDSDSYKAMTVECGVENDVVFLGKTSYLQSLKNMQHADALLLIQDELFKNQIPGKVYEYLNTKLPILVKAPLDSATGLQVHDFDGVAVAEKGEDIFLALSRIVAMGHCHQRPQQAKQHLSRESQARKVVDIANALIGVPGNKQTAQSDA